MLISILLLAIAAFFSWYQPLRKYSFTVWVIAGAASAYITPALYDKIGDLRLSIFIIPLLMVIMFGMGTTLSIDDFKRVMKMPAAVLIGLVCQFSIMPVIGFTLVKFFAFPAEIAAGLILVGCSPSGLASNVMSFIARANVALSITLTATATLLAPLMTPLLMKLLANQYISFSFLDMLWSISKIVLIPTSLGIIYNHFFHGRFPWLDKLMPTLSMAAIVIVIAVIISAGKDNLAGIGAFLILATILHNGFGYLVGYSLCKLIRMPESFCRTIALEVGMQNSGLASGIALEMGKLTTMGLPAVIFGPVMNVSGSLLAGFWKNKPVD